MTQELLPRWSRVEFFLYRESELAASLARAIGNHVSQFPDAPLTDHHAAILAWSAASINVPDGGFTQFFYNHRGDDGVRELAGLLEALDLPKASALLREAAVVFRKHRDEFAVSNPWDGLFGSIKEFGKLDRAFMKVSLRGGRALDTWIREHIADLATDELGGPIDPRFTGTVEIHGATGQIEESLEVRKGRAHGVYREFFEDGTIRDAVFYKAGKLSGDFWPDGRLKRKESKQGKNRVIEWFYPSGATRKRYVKDMDGNPSEPIRLFHLDFCKSC